MHARAGAIQVVVLALLAGLPATAHGQFLSGRLTTAGTDLELEAGAQAPSISPEGGFIALVSTSANIAPFENGSLNVYRYDLLADEYLLAMQVLGSGNSSAPSISLNGLALAFESLADDIAPGNPSGVTDVFYSVAFDAGGGATGFTTVLVSRGLGGAAPNGESRFASVSADGRWVAFLSAASNLVVDDSNGAPDIFVADALDFDAPPERVSVNGAEAQIQGFSRALSPSAISADGRLVAFAVDTPVSIDGSDAGTLEDVFVRDRSAGTTALVSRSSAGVAGNNSSDQAAISPSGRFVAFRSFASNLVDLPSGSRIYVRDRQLAATTNMPLPADAASCEDPRVSDLGDVVVQCNMANGAPQQAVLHRRDGGLFLLSTAVDDGGYANGTSGTYTGISADGNVMVFDSAASDLVAVDGNDATDVFVVIDLAAFNAIFADGFEGDQ